MLTFFYFKFNKIKDNFFYSWFNYISKIHTKEVVNMILSQKIENSYKNCIDNIKKVKNRLDKA